MYNIFIEHEPEFHGNRMIDEQKSFGDAMNRKGRRDKSASLQTGWLLIHNDVNGNRQPCRDAIHRVLYHRVLYHRVL